MTDPSSNQVTVKTLVQAVLRYLAIRIRSKQELVEYVSRKTTDEEMLSQVILYLEKNHLIDDEDFARIWIESRLRHGKGDKIVAYELRQKGVASEIIQRQLASVPESFWVESGNKVICKYQMKWSNLKGFQQKSKMYQIFQSRGFSSSRIDAFLKSRVE